MDSSELQGAPPPRAGKSKLIMIGVALALLALGAAYLAVGRKSWTLTFTEPQLQEKLNERLPWTRRYFFIFDVTLDNPRIDLVEGSDRIAGGVDVILNVTLDGADAALGGTVDLSGAIRYDATTGGLYLTDPRVENVHLAGIPDRYANRANETIGLAIADFYRARPIYVLKPDDVKTSAARLLLKDVTVENEKLRVTLSAASNQR